MTGVAIVAIPAEYDHVWKLSSEEIPHLTLLFLGEEVENLLEIVQFVQHASESMRNFGLSVERRGVLGDKFADVLFFKKDRMIKDVIEFRSQLLKNDNINKAYLSTPQYDSWTPHLTMGYPDAPANPDTRDYPGTDWVSFNRIAVWTGEFDGPVFELSDLEMAEDVAMSSALGESFAHSLLSHAKSDYNLEEEFGWLLDGVESYVEENEADFLEHYGKKGMKWGVRNDKPPLVGLGPDRIERQTKNGDTIALERNPPTAINKGLAAISSKYRESYNSSAFFTVRDAGGKRVGEAVVQKKSDDELYLNWVGVKSSQRGKGYASAIMKAAEDYGSQQGFKKMTLEVPGNAPDARHIYESMGFRVTKEATTTNDIWGGLTEMEYTFANVEHQDNVSRGSSFIGALLEASGDLKHYGKKGMKWGVRKAYDTQAKAASAREAGKSKKADKLDKKAEKQFQESDGRWEKSIYNNTSAIKVHNNVANRVNADLDKLNNDPKYKDKNLYDDPDLEKSYFSDYSKLVDKAYSDAVTEIHGSSPSGRKKAIYRPETENLPARIDVIDKDVKHAEDNEPDLVFLLKRGPKGLVTEMNQAATELMHELEDDSYIIHETEDGPVLVHYGVLGMKWGKTRTPAELAAASAVREKTKASRRGSQDIRVQNKHGGRVRTAGGKRNVATEDAVRAAIVKQKAKASSTNSLTNKELKDTIERMRLEEQYTKLAKAEAKSTRGKRFVDMLLGGDKTVSTMTVPANTNVSTTRELTR